MLLWIQKLIASVPADFVPELSSAVEGETVKGRMPDEIAVWYNASVWALKEANRVREEHKREHEKIELDDLDALDLDIAKMANGCLEARNMEEQLKNRAAVLGVAAKEALVEHFGLKSTDTVEVRAEGVVVIEPVNPLSSFFSMLKGSGISIVRI